MRSCAETTGSYLHTVYSIPFEMCLRHLRRWTLEMVFCFICSVKSCLRSVVLVVCSGVVEQIRALQQSCVSVTGAG